MPAVFGANRPRAELTGLEEPDELWERLKEATAHANALAAANKKLAARVRVVERRLAEAGGLSDDELVAELPKRMSRALESAQGVASEIVRRARKSEGLIRQKAEESAATILRQAESQAAAFLRQSASDAAARVAAADAQAAEILADAHRRRDQVLGELEGQAATLRQRIKVLEKHHGRLLDAYDVVERSLVEARAVLGLPGAAVAPAVAPVPPGDGTPAPARSLPSRSEADTARFRVYDWSPASEAG